MVFSKKLKKNSIARTRTENPVPKTLLVYFYFSFETKDFINATMNLFGALLQGNTAARF